MTTGAASDVTQTEATLNGTVGPEGDATSYRFEYGTSTSYGQQTASASAGSDNTDHPESATVSGLAAGTTYHFRIVATNSAGTSRGADQVFTTRAAPSPAPPPAAVPPGATTGPAKWVHARSAKLTGTADPNGQQTSNRFDYGTSTGYGSSTAAGDAGAGEGDTSVAATVRGLKPHTVYHYRLVATNSAGVTSGGDRTFRTARLPSTMRTSRRVVVAGSRLRVFGRVRVCRPGSRLTLRSRAFAHHRARTRVRKKRSYSARVRVAAGTKPGRYRITGRCAGKRLDRHARISVTVPSFTG